MFSFQAASGCLSAISIATFAKYHKQLLRNEALYAEPISGYFCLLSIPVLDGVKVLMHMRILRHFQWFIIWGGVANVGSSTQNTADLDV